MKETGMDARALREVRGPGGEEGRGRGQNGLCSEPRLGDSGTGVKSSVKLTVMLRCFGRSNFSCLNAFFFGVLRPQLVAHVFPV